MGFIKTQHGFMPLKRLYLHLEEILDYSIKKKWPKFLNLDISKTWNWYINIALNELLDDLSSSEVSRSLNALTYLYEDSDDINKLFWTMIGLEAIYVKGNEGIAEQIKNKGQLYLGDISEFKKRLNEMYSFRSSFIHGSKDFPSYFHIHDGLESYEKYIMDTWEVLLTAESMLIATLQKMAKQKKKELIFKYIIK